MKLPRCEHEGQGCGAANATSVVVIHSCVPHSGQRAPKRAISSKGEQRRGPSAVLLSCTAPEHRQERNLVRKRSEIPHCSPGPPAHVDTRLAEAATSPHGCWTNKKARADWPAGHLRGCTHDLEGDMSNAGVPFNCFIPCNIRAGFGVWTLNPAVEDE